MALERAPGAWAPGGSASPLPGVASRSPMPAAWCPDWMAGLPDALPLSHLSIPGTHDSLSLFGGRRLRCQSWGLESQLAAGIRFLDVRCKLVRGELHIYHLCTFQRASLRGVLRRTLRFLRAHPGEAVLMRIKEELPIFPQPGFAARLHRCLLEEGRGRVWCREEVPTLGQARGKIVVLEALAREVLGIPYEQLSISDSWNVLSLERKWARARQHLERAAGGDPTTMHLTFCSGNGLFTSRYGPGAALGQPGPGRAAGTGGATSPPRMPLCKTVLFLSRVNKNKKKLGKHSLCCLAIS
uniref:Phosphatidylinositol-specific phospholipase C X domain-containing protein n=1 Tax=Otus sunia TaxID=257818 RepID=A0A8C8AC83_9STRI